MDIAGKVIVVTGGASGIGAAMARRFARESPRAVHGAAASRFGWACAISC
jgi:NAD(P)-dependent dehydrogenase (short-subunit alcohol dehydrogenase family)